MKKIVLSIAVAAALLTSCSKTLNEKAEALIEDEITENIVGDGTYAAIETRVDSAYAPLENPELYKLFDKYVKATNDLMKHHEMISEMQFQLGKFTDRYSDELIASLGPIITSLESYVSLMENMDRMMDMPHEFVGYRAVHRYNAKENGTDAEREDVFMLNKDMSSVEYHMPFKNYVFMNEQLKKMKENIKATIETYRNTIEIAKKLAE